VPEGFKDRRYVYNVDHEGLVNVLSHELNGTVNGLMGPRRRLARRASCPTPLWFACPQAPHPSDGSVANR
jgi:hypothetical protein